MNTPAVQNHDSINWHTFHPVGKFFVAVFLIILLEGAIRKWLWGSATIPALGLRDLIVILAVTWGFLNRYFDFHAWPEILLTFWTFLIISWSGIQMMSGLQPPIVAVIGFRFWILYLWFALLCARAMQWQDIEYLFKIFAMTLLFMVPLALLQFMSPPTSFINRQAGGEDQLIFTVIKDIVRTTGTFSFTAGYTTYLAFVTPAVLWLMSGGPKDSIKTPTRLLIIGLFFVGALISGSRGAIATTLLFAGVWFLSLIIANKVPRLSPAKALLGFTGLLIIFFLLFPILEKSYEANTQRFDSAASQEDVGVRIVNMFTGSSEAWNQFNILGYGIGAGANASRSFMPESSDGFLLGENEIDRTLSEGGLIGLLLALLKWLMIFIGLLSSWKIFKNNNELIPLSIWIVLAVHLPTASIIGQLTVHGFMLLLLSLGLTSLACWPNEKLRRLNKQR